MSDPFEDMRDPLVKSMARNELRRLIKARDEAIQLVRCYFWCESRAEGRRIDAAAMKFLDANGGREFPENGNDGR